MKEHIPVDKLQLGLKGFHAEGVSKAHHGGDRESAQERYLILEILRRCPTGGAYPL